MDHLRIAKSMTVFLSLVTGLMLFSVLVWAVGMFVRDHGWTVVLVSAGSLVLLGRISWLIAGRIP